MALIQQTSQTISSVPPTTDKAITRWVGTNGDTIQNSPGTLVQDGGAIQSSGTIDNRAVTDLITIPSNYTMISANLEIEDGEIIIEEDAELLVI